MEYYLRDFLNEDNIIYIGNFSNDLLFWSYFNLNLSMIKQQEYEISKHYLWIMYKI